MGPLGWILIILLILGAVTAFNGYSYYSAKNFYTQKHGGRKPGEPKKAIMIGISSNNRIYLRPSLEEPWEGPVPNSCNGICMRKVIALKNDSFLGLGTDNQLYTRKDLFNAGWSLIESTNPISKKIKTITQLKDSRFLAITTDQKTYIKSSLNEEDWTEIISESQTAAANKAKEEAKLTPKQLAEKKKTDKMLRDKMIRDALISAKTQKKLDGDLKRRGLGFVANANKVARDNREREINKRILNYPTGSKSSSTAASKLSDMIDVSQLYDERYIAVGLDGNIYIRNLLGSDWVPMSTDVGFRSFSQLADKTLVAIGNGRQAASGKTFWRTNFRPPAWQAIDEMEDVELISITGVPNPFAYSFAPPAPASGAAATAAAAPVAMKGGAPIDLSAIPFSSGSFFNTTKDTAAVASAAKPADNPLPPPIPMGKLKADKIKESGAPLEPSKVAFLIGISRNNRIYIKPSLYDDWIGPFAKSCPDGSCFTQMIQLIDGSFLGIKNGELWRNEQLLDGEWTKTGDEKNGSIVSIAQRWRGGMFIAVIEDTKKNNTAVYYKKLLTDKWEMVPTSENVESVIELFDESLVAIRSGRLYGKTSLTDQKPWTLLRTDDNGKVMSLTQLVDKSFVAIGDNGDGTQKYKSYWKKYLNDYTWKELPDKTRTDIISVCAVRIPFEYVLDDMLKAVLTAQLTGSIRQTDPKVVEIAKGGGAQRGGGSRYGTGSAMQRSIKIQRPYLE